MWASCRSIVAAVLLASSLLAAAPAAQELVEWSVETRTVLTFQVNADALQQRLPAGWMIDPSTAPASRGANLTVTFLERLLVLDGRGTAVQTGTSRYVVLTVPAKRTADGVTNVVVIGGISPEGAGAYGTSQPATVARAQRSYAGEGQVGGHAREGWEFASANGDRLRLQLTYDRGLATRSRAESHLRSALRPDFTRTYRIDQTTDVVKSGPIGVDRVVEWIFSASGPTLAPLFDGRETLVSVSVIPSYVREITVP